MTSVPPRSRLSCAVGLAMALAAPAAARPLSIASVSSGGSPVVGILPTISANGRFVVFTASVNNVVPGDTNNKSDVFVRDLQNGTTVRVSVSSGGVEGNGDSGITRPAISADGRFVAFISLATNLVPGDTNNTLDLFVRDTLNGTTICASVNYSTGLPAGVGGSDFVPSISADGRFVTFCSGYATHVPGDTNGERDVFVRDTTLNTTQRVSVKTGGAQGAVGRASVGGSISADGSRVAFKSSANLVPGDNNLGHVYVHDLGTLTTYLVSVSSSGELANGPTWGLLPSPALSADGRCVLWVSTATNLVPQQFSVAPGAYRYVMCLRDLVAGTTEAVNLSSSGEPAFSQSTGDPVYTALSADGRFVAFSSHAQNLVPTAPGTADLSQVYIRDRASGVTRILSETMGGDRANNSAVWPFVSADGSVVGFTCYATNLIPGSPTPAVYVTDNPCTALSCYDVTFADPAPGSFLWSDTANWTSSFPANAPDNPVETAILDRAGAYEVTLDEVVACGGLRVAAGQPSVRALSNSDLTLSPPSCPCSGVQLDVSGAESGANAATLRLIQDDSGGQPRFGLDGNATVGAGEGNTGEVHLFGGFLDMTGSMVVGDGNGAGLGVLRATAKGLLIVESGSLVIARGSATGNVSVSSDPFPAGSSRIQVEAGAICVGEGGNGSADVHLGGKIIAPSVIVSRQDPDPNDNSTFDSQALVHDAGSVIEVFGRSSVEGGFSNALVVGESGWGEVLVSGDGELRFTLADGRTPDLVLGGAGPGFAHGEVTFSTSGVLTGSPALRMGASAAAEGLLRIQTPGTFAFDHAVLAEAPGATATAEVSGAGTDLAISQRGLDPIAELTACHIGLAGTGTIDASQCATVHLLDTEIGAFSGSGGHVLVSSDAAVFAAKCVVADREPGATGEINVQTGGLFSCSELVLGAGATIVGDRFTVTSIGGLSGGNGCPSLRAGAPGEARIETADLAIDTVFSGGTPPTISVTTFEILPGASFSGHGPFSFDVPNSGTVRPAGAGRVGTMTLEQGYQQSITGALEIDVDPNYPNPFGWPHDRLEVLGEAELSGTLRVVLPAGVGPLVEGLSMPVLQAGLVSGAFLNVEVVAPDGSYTGEASYSGQDVSVVITLAPPANCPGDANGDAVVSFSDVTSVLANFGASYAPATGPGDANHDGAVNFADITSVLANFGVPCN